MRKSSLKAFSILELMITMVVISIVFGIGYSFYGFFNQQLMKHQRNTKVVLQMDLLNTLLKRDVEAAEVIEAETDKKINFQFKEFNVQYTFFDNLILRNQAQKTDTFKLSVLSSSLEKLAKENRLTKQTKSTNWVKSVNLEVELLGEKHEIFIQKNYGKKHEISFNY